jgi:hypothetical protein
MMPQADIRSFFECARSWLTNSLAVAKSSSLLDESIIEDLQQLKIELTDKISKWNIS